jgi:arginase
MKNASLIGAAIDFGQSKTGVDLAPCWLRLKGLRELLSQKFFQIHDLGDISSELLEVDLSQPRPEAKNIRTLAKYAKRLFHIAFDEMDAGRMPITVGGDHSIAIGTLAASLTMDDDIKVIWVDAHGDINTPKTTYTGHVHGMPVALAMGLVEEDECLQQFNWFPRLKPENLSYIGLRDLDSGESEFIKQLNIQSFTAEDVAKLGIHQVLDRVMKHLDPNGHSQFHLSFDVDALDPEFMPSTGTPVNNGLGLFDGREIIRRVSRTGRMLAFDFVEVNPTLGSAEDVELTKESAFALLDALEGWQDIGHPITNHRIFQEIRPE